MLSDPLVIVPSDAPFHQVSMHLLVLSAFRRQPRLDRHAGRVSMHLLVLSAFRLKIMNMKIAVTVSLNAPSGAQCFPTMGIFITSYARDMSQCTFWCSVLSDGIKNIDGYSNFFKSQCTFWCSVLSDVKSRPLNRSGWRRLNAPSGAQCFQT